MKFILTLGQQVSPTIREALYNHLQKICTDSNGVVELSIDEEP